VVGGEWVSGEEERSQDEEKGMEKRLDNVR